MAIVYITGKPGHGKTLYAIWHIKKYIENDHKSKLKTDTSAKPRPVYYHGINGLKNLDWILLKDPQKWYEVPAGAVIVIDEAQHHYPSLSNSAKRPKSYTMIDTHRHQGHDVFHITQDPVNVDKRFTTMCDRHYHLARAFNTDKATLYEFQGVEYVSGTKFKRVPDAIKKQWPYPKEIYDYYESAEVHTYKTRLPIQKLALYALPFVGIAFLIPSIWNSVQTRGGVVNTHTDSAESLDSHPGQTGSFPGGLSSLNPFAGKTTASLIPTIPNDPLSIPLYQPLITIQAYQRIDGCAHMVFGRVESCTCRDQRGNKLKVDFNACLLILSDGYFDYSIPDDLTADNQSDQSNQLDGVDSPSPSDILF